MSKLTWHRVKASGHEARLSSAALDRYLVRKDFWGWGLTLPGEEKVQLTRTNHQTHYRTKEQAQQAAQQHRDVHA